MLDGRLLACAELCNPGRAADIGTDHGYLPIYLIESGICESCIACDINEKPLLSARENIRAAGLEGRIETILSDGLDSVEPEGITNVIIAGMGGELIRDIISRAEWLRNSRTALILQPMTKWDVLRRYLYESGFEVTKELPCRAGRFVYSVLRAEYTGRQPEHECDLCYLYGGMVSPETEDGRAYLLRQAERLGAVAGGIGRDASRAAEAEKYADACAKLRQRCEIKER